MISQGRYLSLRASSICFLRILILLSSYSFQQAHSNDLGTRNRTFEGEDADVYSGGSKKVNENPKYKGYSGIGYADLGGKGSFVQWDVETTFMADYVINIRYSAPDQRSCYLYVDQIKRGEYSISTTDSWNDWNSESLTVFLDKGNHQIKIVVVDDDWGPNVDFMSISGQVKTASDDDDDNNNVIHREVALMKDSKISRGKFIPSLNGHYKIGLVDSTGEFVIIDNNSNAITWSNGVLGGEESIMQGDGNLVVRNDDGKAIWNTESSGNNGAHLTINDTGIAAIVLKSNKIWTTTSADLINPKHEDVLNPNFRNFPEEVVLKSRDSLVRGKFVSSPSNKYNIGLNDVGDLLLQDSNQNTIWNANVKGCIEATMQPDGNFVLRDGSDKLIWTTHTSKNPGARLVVDDGGRLSLMMGQTAIWMEGVPRGTYNGPSSRSLQFPLRGIFYYPWYPETWSVNSKPIKFVPDLGKYSSDDTNIVEEHVDAMEYSYTDVAIASWWGPGTSQELSRISLLMDKTIELNSSIKWTIYYEDEMFRNPSTDKIRSDLDYLFKWFVWHPAWAHIEDKPVIFVYNEAGCSVTERWEAAKNDWYVVFKIFPGHKNCKFQPDSWHQYGPSTEYIHLEGISTSISPGFWRADKDKPKLPRVSKDKFCENAKNMVEEGEDWQLITTFNEAGEGTMVEASSDNWGSDTKYGYYLDCLHENY